MKSRSNLLEQTLNLPKRWFTPFVTWTELGLWGIIGIGSFLGAFKINVPLSPSIISLMYDALCFGVLFYVVIRRIRYSKKLLIPSSFFLVLLFIGFSAITILNPYLTSVIRGILGWRFLASSLLFVFLGFYAFNDVQRVWRLIRFFWLIGMVVAMYGIVQIIRGYTPAEMEWVSELTATMKIAGTGRYRIMSTLASAVDLGFFLSLTIPSLFSIFLSTRKYRNGFWLMAILMMSVSLLFTFVRAAWIATFVSCLVLVIIRFWQFKNIRLLLPSLLILGLLTMSLLPSIAKTIADQTNDIALQERIGSLADPFNDHSMLERYSKWEKIWQLTRQYPWGIGVGMTGATSLKYSGGDLAPVTMDNSYLKIIVETGWLGFGIFIFMIMNIFFKMKQILTYLRGEYKLLGMSLFSIFVAYIIILFFGEYIELNPSRMLIWILLGIFFSLPRLQASANI